MIVIYMSFRSTQVKAQYVLEESQRFGDFIMPKPQYHKYPLVWAEEKFNKDCAISLEDFDLLCRTVFCEAGNQSFEAQRVTALAILYRLLNDKFPNTLHDVVYQRNPTQFDVIDWPGFPNAYDYTDQVELACYTAVTEYPLENTKMMFFRSKHYFSGLPRYKHEDDMYFSLCD